ncbi:MAG: hypothetical protein KY458_13240 [Actinobacteria bacterium]|nr:hypothetical protein [Actinomycetota bacterium]
MATTRYRCNACGNLTRFTVTSMRRTTAFHHFTVAGDLTVEDEDVVDEQVEEVTCRWCGNGSAVVRLPPAPDHPPGQLPVADAAPGSRP